MNRSKRSTIVAGNWKMYKTIEEAVDYVKELAPMVQESPVQVYIAVPFTAIKQVAEQTQGGKIIIGAQNMNDATEGAFTGEIAGRMLKDAGAQFVIIGHSERRHIFNEDNAFINRKVKRALADGLQPILCIGETLEEREAGKTEEVLETQLTQSLADINKEQMGNMIIAYEPVWAIGTGKTATPEQAQEIHQFCRGIIEKMYNKTIANKTVILYGGSVKPENAKALMDKPDIDGVLVGGASLKIESFSQIVNYQTVKIG